MTLFNEVDSVYSDTSLRNFAVLYVTLRVKTFITLPTLPFQRKIKKYIYTSGYLKKNG